MSARTTAYEIHTRHPRASTSAARMTAASPGARHPHAQSATSAGTVAADSFAPTAIAKSTALPMAAPHSIAPSLLVERSHHHQHARDAGQRRDRLRGARDIRDGLHVQRMHGEEQRAEERRRAWAARARAARAPPLRTARRARPNTSERAAVEPPLTFQSSAYTNCTTGRKSPARPHSAGQYATRHAVSSPEGACSAGLSAMIGPSS